MDQTRWDEAVVAVTTSLSTQGARERGRHARGFAAWCAERGLDPATAERGALERYIESLPGSDGQLKAKARCALRAILREIDPEHAARAAGLGNQASLLENLPEGLSALVHMTVERRPERRAVIASALTRLLAWCEEVDANPLCITPTDLPQFRRWLVEVGTTVPETMVVAADFLDLRYSAAGRELLGEHRAPRPLAIELEAPLRARFS